MEEIIQIKNLQKSFEDIKAVQNISFKVKKGELFAFLGVNGAGKSTTISIMCGQLERDGGEIIIDGINLDDDVDKIKTRLGVVFQNSALDEPLTVRDNLESRAACYGINKDAFKKRLEELTELFDLEKLLSRKVGKLSGGQRRRIDIARALIHKPSILILDEPTTGLDPQTRKMIWEIVENLRKKEGLTVFLTTHYMEEAADADFVVVIDSGKIVAEGTPIDLKNSYTGDYINLYNVSEEQVKSLNMPYEKMHDMYRISITNTKEATVLIANNQEIFSDYEIIKGKMDDVFLAVTGKKLDGGNEK